MAYAGLSGSAAVVHWQSWGRESELVATLHYKTTVCRPLFSIFYTLLLKTLESTLEEATLERSCERMSKEIQQLFTLSDSTESFTQLMRWDRK